MTAPKPTPTSPKPLLRGWLHAAMTPLALVLGIVLVLLAHNDAGRIGGAVWLAASVALFGTSALYHRGNWTGRREVLWRRLDHANIFIFIAASYTPLALLLLPPASYTVLLWLVWTVAVAGVFFQLVWINSPRWVHTLLYLLMGWAALGWIGDFWTNGGPLQFTLISLGGLIYTLGAIVYARRNPDPWPTTFGYHEIFHSATIIAALCHYTAIMAATLA
ncbi:MAG: hemolysin III family protein [Micropruina sp.]|nr:hemolysin III family protein [Micropruina sp.]